MPWCFSSQVFPAILLFICVCADGFQYLIMIINLMQLIDFISCLYFWSTSSKNCNCWSEKEVNFIQFNANGSDLKAFICNSVATGNFKSMAEIAVFD